MADEFVIKRDIHEHDINKSHFVTLKHRLISF